MSVSVISRRTKGCSENSLFPVYSGCKRLKINGKTLCRHTELSYICTPKN
nr:MAG TPA: hypothetical protein [Caudoviricetes sp.]